MTAAAVAAGAALGGAAGQVTGAPQAAASWRAAASSPGQGVALAALEATLEPRSGASAGSRSNPYAAGGLVTGGDVLVDVVNTSLVPARAAVVLTSAGVVSSAPGVQACAVAWTATGTCASPVAVPVTRTASAGSTLTSWSVDLPPDGRQRLKVSTAVGVISGFSLAATPGYALPRTGLDRSAA